LRAAVSGRSKEQAVLRTPVTDADHQKVIDLLLRDLQATVGSDHDELEAIPQIAGIGLNTLGAITMGEHWASLGG
jgi:hypothetical protein